MLKRFHGWWSTNGQTNWFVVLCTLTLTPTPKPTKNSTDQTSFPQDFQLLLPQIHLYSKGATYSLFLQEIDFQTNFSVQSPMNLGPLSSSTSWSTRKTQSKIWLKSKGMFRINYGTFWDVFSLRKKDGNECSCDDNVVTRQQHYFCRFLAQSFRAKRLYNNGQDIPRRCLFSSRRSTFDKSTSADPQLTTQKCWSPPDRFFPVPKGRKDQ